MELTPGSTSPIGGLTKRCSLPTETSILDDEDRDDQRELLKSLWYALSILLEFTP